MYWFWIPVILIAVVIVLAIMGAALRKRSTGGRQDGQVVYDENTNQRPRKSPEAPPV